MSPQADAGRKESLCALVSELEAALLTTRGNIASLGPAGALGPNGQYREWLNLVDAALAKAERLQAQCKATERRVIEQRDTMRLVTGILRVSL